MTAKVTVTVSGPVGSGKSRIAAEIEIALKAIGVTVSWCRHEDEREARLEMHSEAAALWQPELPDIVLQEIVTPISIAEGVRRLAP